MTATNELKCGACGETYYAVDDAVPCPTCGTEPFVDGVHATPKTDPDHADNMTREDVHLAGVFERTSIMTDVKAFARLLSDLNISEKPADDAERARYSAYWMFRGLLGADDVTLDDLFLICDDPSSHPQRRIAALHTVALRLLRAAENYIPEPETWRRP